MTLLDGSRFASAIRANGRPSPIRLPDDSDDRAALIDSHLLGLPATLSFVSSGRGEWTERVLIVALGAYNPAADGRARWIGMDLDAADHGAGGLADPAHAARVIAERADAAGLGDGLIVARSRGGRGRHAWIIPPHPVPVEDAALAVAMLGAMSWATAQLDTRDGDARHAFRRADGAIARPGDPGAFELVPRSDTRPAMGWALTLPMAGAYRASGGGVIVDPYTDEPAQPDRVPRCDTDAWSRFIDEARSLDRAARVRNAVQRGSQRPRDRRPWARPIRSQRSAPTLDRLDPRTMDFLEGRVAEGGRNVAGFAAACELLGRGFHPDDAAPLILAGARLCGLPEREARVILKSARRRMKGGCQ